MTRRGGRCFKGYEALADGLPDGVAGPMIVGTIAAAVSGYLAIAGLLRLRAHPQLRRLRRLPGPVGVGVLVLIASGAYSATF